MIKANNPNLKTWIEVKEGSDFPIQNLPFGIFKAKDSPPSAASAIGDFVIDLDRLHKLGFFHEIKLPEDVFEHTTLNFFISLGKSITRAVRERLAELLNIDNSELQEQQELHTQVFIPMAEVKMLMPVHIHGNMHNIHTE